MSNFYSKYVVAESTTGGKYLEVEIEDAELRTRTGAVRQDKKWSSQTCTSHEDVFDQGYKKLASKLSKEYTLGRSPRPIRAAVAPGELHTHPLVAELYFRALDRYPGGNADMFVVKWLALLLPDKAPRLFHHEVLDYDGQQIFTFPDEIEADPKRAASLLDALAAYMQSTSGSELYQIRETRYDREAYDTEWSWLEFAFFPLPEGATTFGDYDARAPIARIEQVSTVGSKVASPPPEAQALLDAALALTGMSTPASYSDGGRPSPSKDHGSISFGYLSYPPLPLYLTGSPQVSTAGPKDGLSEQEMFGELRSIFASDSEDLFCEVCEVLGDGDVSEEVLAYVEEGLSRHAGKITRQAPARWVERIVGGERCAAMRLCHHLSRNFAPLSVEQAQHLAAAPELENLRTVELISAGIEREQAVALAAAEHLKSLRLLDMHDNKTDHEGYQAIIGSKTLPKGAIVQAFRKVQGNRPVIKG